LEKEEEKKGKRKKGISTLKAGQRSPVSLKLKLPRLDTNLYERGGERDVFKKEGFRQGTGQEVLTTPLSLKMKTEGQKWEGAGPYREGKRWA